MYIVHCISSFHISNVSIPAFHQLKIYHIQHFTTTKRIAIPQRPLTARLRGQVPARDTSCSLVRRPVSLTLYTTSTPVPRLVASTSSSVASTWWWWWCRWWWWWWWWWWGAPLRRSRRRPWRAAGSGGGRGRPWRGPRWGEGALRLYSCMALDKVLGRH